MVTGVETAGLVLAVFPLVVKGMQYYAEGLQTIQYWRRYRRELQNHARRIKTQWVRYLNTIELLFEGIVGSDEELAGACLCCPSVEDTAVSLSLWDSRRELPLIPS